MDFDRDRLQAQAEAIGDHLLSCYVATKADLGITIRPGQAESKDMCRASAYATAQILSELTGHPWRVEAGWVHPPKSAEDYPKFRMDQFPGGMLDTAGQWQGHYWAASVSVADGLRLIVDLAADQFGHPDVIVTESTDPRYRSNILPATVEAELGYGSRIYGSHWASDFLSRYQPAPELASPRRR